MQMFVLDTLYLSTKAGKFGEILPIVAVLTPLRCAHTKEHSEVGAGGSLCCCCGLQLVTPLTIDAKNHGITVSVTDKPDKVEAVAKAVIENVKVGDTWFNFKLRTEA
jgi:hypothetical protein